MTRATDVAVLVTVVFGFSLNAQSRPQLTPRTLAQFSASIAGDAIYELNGSRIGALEELRTALDAKKAGDPIALLIERSGQLVYVSFELE